jgi:flagellin
VRLNIGDASVNGLFANGLFDLLSANNASLASGAVSTAIDLLTSLRADVGAYQEALNYTGANIDSALQNQEAARANLLDTDIASESTQLAIAALQQQSGIALQAQVNRLIPTMLDLLKGS